MPEIKIDSIKKPCAFPTLQKTIVLESQIRSIQKTHVPHALTHTQTPMAPAQIKPVLNHTRDIKPIIIKINRLKIDNLKKKKKRKKNEEKENDQEACVKRFVRIMRKKKNAL